MILDLIDHQLFYRGMVPGLDAGFDFLKRTDLAALEDGRHAIDGDRVFALMTHGGIIGIRGVGPECTVALLRTQHHIVTTIWQFTTHVRRNRHAPLH